MLTIDTAKDLVVDTYGASVNGATWAKEYGHPVVLVTFTSPEPSEAGEHIATVWEGEDIDGMPVLYCDA